MTMRLVTQSVGDALVDSLRDRVLSEDIAAGVAVTEAAIAGEYGVARQTAKAAIERLVVEGLLERTAHRSARVPVLTEEQVRDLYFARGAIETRSYELLAQEQRLDDAVQRAHERFTELVETGDVAALVVADVALHQALVACLRSPRLSRAHDLIINEIRLCLAQVQSHQLLDAREIAAEHEGILTAIRKGDVNEAREAGLAHLAHAERKLLKDLTER